LPSRSDRCPDRHLGLKATAKSHGRAICLAIAAQQAQPFGGALDRSSVVNGNIFNSKGVHVGVVTGDAVFGLKGQKLYDLKGANIYKLNGDLVGHLSDARGAEKRLDKATDKLFPPT
jgi:sporulation protein YlmC with PRC-barrel domain